MSTRGRPPRTAVLQRPAWANRLIAARKKAGLSQTRLAELAGTSQSSIADYENGRSTPNLNVVKRLAQALEAPEDFLINESPSTNKSSASESKGLFPDKIYKSELQKRVLGRRKSEEFSDSTANSILFVEAGSKIVKMLHEEEPGSILDSTTLLWLTRQAWEIAMLRGEDLPLERRIDSAVDLMRLARRLSARFPDLTTDNLTFDHIKHTDSED